MPSGVYKHKLTLGSFKKGNKVGFKKGYIPWNKGKTISEESKKKIRDYQIKKWDKIGRKEYKRYIHLSNTYEYRKWRATIFQRDNWVCQTCNQRGCYLEAHHIKSWAKYPKLRFIVKNGITLCRECHKLINKTCFLKNNAYNF